MMERENRNWFVRYLHPVDFGGVILWLFAWFQNAHGGHFDLDRFWQMFLAVRGWITAQYYVDSKYNSLQGKNPGGMKRDNAR